MDGRFLFAEHQGAYVLKLVGDVRLTLCSTIDQFVERMFKGVSCQSVVVDLTETEGLDSTTLGLLAKMALFVRKQWQIRPMAVTDSEDIIRLLGSMGFEQIFDIQRSCKVNAVADCELLPENMDEKTAREKVLQAHQVLMTLNQNNRQAFRELVDSLCKGDNH
jgi:anti-anti-sigma factor